VRDRRWRAVLAQGEQLVALAGLSAAALHGLTGFDDDDVHVVVPHGARVHRLPGVKVHVSRRFSVADLHPSRRPPTVRVERAVIDAAVWAHSPRRACAVVASAVQQRLTTAARLLAELDACGQVRHRRLLTGVLADIGGGAQALSELDLVQLCRRRRLPEPALQVVRRDRDGRRRWLDAVFAMPDGRELVVEVDGAGHLTVEQYVDDLDRTIELVIDGKTVVRVAAVTLRLAPERFAEQLARLLQVGGGRAEGRPAATTMTLAPLQTWVSPAP
jgi:very-short-patch-repair endonuclease